jgi:hypothetical protein
MADPGAPYNRLRAKGNPLAEVEDTRPAAPGRVHRYSAYAARVEGGLRVGILIKRDDYAVVSERSIVVHADDARTFVAELQKILAEH